MLLCKANCTTSDTVACIQFQLQTKKDFFAPRIPLQLHALLVAKFLIYKISYFVSAVKRIWFFTYKMFFSTMTTKPFQQFIPLL